jgi:cytochrome c oxidase cbb3-type subunit 4
MDAGIWRALFTLLMFVAFIGVCVWAWSSRRKGDFEEAANLPLEDDSALNAPRDSASKPTARSS